MMDNRPPDKRLRVDSASWQVENRELPHPRGPGEARRHAEVLQHYGPEDPRRGPQAPMPYNSAFNPLHPPPPPGTGPGLREPTIKLDPSGDRNPQLQHVRPHSTGHEVRIDLPHDDSRRSNMAGFETIPGPPHPHQYHHGLPPSPSIQPPVQQYFGNPFEPSTMGGMRETIYAEYGGLVGAQKSTGAKKTPRTSQACEACRQAKAKCTDPKPCVACTDKGIECKWEPPAPKPTDRLQSDLMNHLAAILDKMTKMEQSLENVQQRQAVVERALIHAIPGLDENIKVERNAVEELRREELYNISRPPTQRAGIDEMAFAESLARQRQFEEAHEFEKEESEEETGRNIPVEEPSIPYGHTTGAALLLQWPSIAHIVRSVMQEKKLKGDPLAKENRRGVIRLYGRGEGLQASSGYDRDPMADSTKDDDSPPQPDSTSPPQFDGVWGQVGGASPAADVQVVTHPRGLGVDSTGMPQIDEGTVTRLCETYMREINIMHPIITQKNLESLKRTFFRQIRECTPEKGVSASFLGATASIGTEITGSKRKRPSSSDEYLSIRHLKAGRPQRSISTAIILLILALGSICEHRERIPDVLPDHEGSAGSSPARTTGAGSYWKSPSPIQQSPIISSASSALPSPRDVEGKRFGRRLSTDGKFSSGYARNLDVIPGLAYFAIATDIIGNHIGGNCLQYVHANILAGLYHGQLGRVLQSHAFIKEAGYSLFILLKPRLERFQKMISNTSEFRPQDNPLLFAFWTCLQLESDIIAELDIPQSGILTLEGIIPWPNCSHAKKQGEMNENEVQCYTAQLYFRKSLNHIHRDLYGPGKDASYELAMMNNKDRFPLIEEFESSLASIMNFAPLAQWNDNSPLADNILEARLRAKFYGAQVIIYRHFLRMVLNNPYTEVAIPDANISPVIKNYAEKCVKAMLNGVNAFNGIGGGRLIVTNPWGTSHAQWGHCLVLHAVYLNPSLRHLIDPGELRRMTLNVRNFLEMFAQKYSALRDDILILDCASSRSGLSPMPHPNQSFSSVNSG